MYYRGYRDNINLTLPIIITILGSDKNMGQINCTLLSPRHELSEWKGGKVNKSQ